ncbi:uncharacterized protein AKAME5_000256300 [Lates japonicus]|uniref:CCHC-type domain-containing protein n=1 Tax=Lates japonicus TaxID=270547 RepID=A0AAD3QXQ9_LATJO|nr:uncharacterized protein AKAME5_000256300 [Lates japonicus]
MILPGTSAAANAPKICNSTSQKETVPSIQTFYFLHTTCQYSGASCHSHAQRCHRSTPAAPAASVAPAAASSDALLATMQSLARSIQGIETPLQSLEDAPALSSRALIAFPQPSFPPLTPGSASEVSTHSMLVGDSQAVSCFTCGNLGHTAPFCPQLPFLPSQLRNPNTPQPKPLTLARANCRGRKRMQGCPSSISMPTPSDPSPVSPPSAGDSAKLKNFLSIHSSTPINLLALAAELSSHPDSVFTDNLLTGLSQGFRVGILSSPDL